MIINELLNRIQVSGKGAKIGDISIQAPACADDVTVLSNDPKSLQFIVHICEDSSERMDMSHKKSKVS